MFLLSFKILSILATSSSSTTWSRLGRHLNAVMHPQIRPSEDAVARARAAAERRRRANSEASSNDGTEDGLPLIGDSLLQVSPTMKSMCRIILGVSSQAGGHGWLRTDCALGNGYRLFTRLGWPVHCVK
jgi:hypothetical protein